LAGVGLVSAATWADVNGDGWPDLLLACEWGPVRLFINQAGKLQEQTEAWGLAGYSGWWNGIAVGDFDGDGRLDVVVANAGRNTRYQPHLKEPVRLFYGDFTGGGGVDMLEAYSDSAMGQIVPWRSLASVAGSLPFLQDQFSTHRAYAEANVNQILGSRMTTAGQLQVNWLDTTIFINRGGKFDARALPVEAQFAPGFAVCVGDLDGDGTDDIFLSQNLFDVHPEDWPLLSGRGLWLANDGHGAFSAMPGQLNGIRLYGEQRGAALCDYDADGRIDLAVAQNGDPTVLYHNVLAKPGLRVRLAGPKGNPTAVGAVLRLVYADHRGPARDIHAGAGYWSQDSAVQVLGLAGTPTHLWVRWPGGRVTESELPASAREVVLQADGRLEVAVPPGSKNTL